MSSEKYLNVQLDDGAIMPDRAHETDAGLDLFAREEFVVPAHGYAFHDTGVHIELPPFTRGHVCSKSGLNRDHGIIVDGTIDVGYTGTIGVCLHNDSSYDHVFERGNKIAQIVIEKIICPMPIEVAEISGGDRGDDGYGSTGV